MCDDERLLDYWLADLEEKEKGKEDNKEYPEGEDWENRELYHFLNH